MSTKHLLDPDLVPVIEQMPALDMTIDMVPQKRIEFMEMRVMGDAEAAGVVREEIHVPGHEGDPDVRCLKYTSRNRSTPSAAYLHIHGGGYTVGTPEMADEMNIRIAADLGILVLSVDYRLAPEHPIPAPLHDCYAALAWLHGNAAALGIKPDAIGVGGESAGGGLAAALALKARDAGAYPICFQLLVYPMIDDRTGTDAQPGDPTTGEFVWTRHNNQFGWNAYLGDAPRTAPQVPARAPSLKGLPPTWMATAALDLFREENVQYAQRLMADEVPTELQVYPGACHGFQLVRDAGVSKRYVKDFFGALKRGLAITD